MENNPIFYVPVPVICGGQIVQYKTEGNYYYVKISDTHPMNGAIACSLIYPPGAKANYVVGDRVKVLVMMMFGGVEMKIQGVMRSAKHYILGLNDKGLIFPLEEGPSYLRNEKDHSFLNRDNDAGLLATDDGCAIITTRGAIKTIHSPFGNGIYEEPINGRTRIDFTLNTHISLKEVNKKRPDNEEEINVGYGTVKQKNSIYQISKIDTVYKKYAIYNSIYDLIRGELMGEGVRVDPGNNILIEGLNTLIGPTSPLMVVDGMIVGSIDYIHPQMVKSIEVLKGASASVYGSRGSNGVILITLVSATDLK